MILYSFLEDINDEKSSFFKLEFGMKSFHY